MQALLHVTRIVAASSHVNCPLGSGSACNTGLPTAAANSSNLSTLLSVVFGVIGVICVIMIAIGGLRFVIARGDPSGTAKARMTIIYALVGLTLAVSAEVIVAFVLKTVKP